VPQNLVLASTALPVKDIPLPSAARWGIYLHELGNLRNIQLGVVNGHLDFHL